MYSLIIILGLAIGLAATLMIAQYIHFETTFDKHHKETNNIFYTYMRWNTENEVYDLECHPAVAPLFKQAIPEIEYAARLTPLGFEKGPELLLKWGQEERQSYSREDQLFLADADILKIFSIPLLKGDPRTVLQDENTVVLTRRLAEKFFPDNDPLNQELRLKIYNQLVRFTVVGVVENPAPNSSIQFNALFSMATLTSTFGNDRIDLVWWHPVYKTFVKLYSRSNPDDVERKVNKAAEGPLSKLESDFHIKESIHLYPFSDFHFYNAYWSGGQGSVRFTGDKRIIQYFSALAGLILIISWANSINLATARALRRAKEVGLRKVNGANRNQILQQFLLESLFMNSISMVLAFTITQLFFSTFATAIGSKAEWILWNDPMFWVTTSLCLLLSTVASGIYPAFVMSNYNPNKVLKGNFSRSQAGLFIRKSLIVTQFIFAVLLLTSIYIISRQFYFLQNKDIGLSGDQVLVIRVMDLDTALDRHSAHQQWRTKLERETYVINTAASFSFPGEQGPASQVYYLATDEDKKQYLFVTNRVSDNYFTTLNMRVLYGRDFNSGYAGEEGKIIINEKAAQEMGFKNADSALGVKITLRRQEKEFEVVGVVKDAVTSMKLALRGQVYFYKSWQTDVDHYNYFLAKLSLAQLGSSLSRIERQWNSLFQNAPFDYFFLDAYFDTFYKEERQFAGVFGFFSIVGIAVTCMGLFGLSLYNTGSRTKEIGIRKSLGGTARSIMWLFSKDYLKLVVIASSIGAPLAMWMLNNWLQNYPNHVDLKIDALIVPMVIAVFVAMLTVGYHTYKTAYMNPVKSLRAD